MQKRKKMLRYGAGAGGQYSQRSEAEQVLEGVNFNFIDFIMSQISEMIVPKIDFKVIGFKD